MTRYGRLPSVNVLRIEVCVYLGLYKTGTTGLGMTMLHLDPTEPSHEAASRLRMLCIFDQSAGVI